MLSHLVAALEGVVSGVGKEVGSRARFLSVVELPAKASATRILRKLGPSILNRTNPTCVPSDITFS